MLMLLEIFYALLATTVSTDVLPSTAIASNGPPPPSPSPPVTVQVMSESLCIDCQRFFQQSLIPAYRTLGPSVMDLQVIPFGNSRIDEDTKTVTCQHGQAECDANTWEQCALELYPNPEVYIDFFGCLEDALPMGHKDDTFPESIFQKCAGAVAVAAAAGAAATANDRTFLVDDDSAAISIAHNKYAGLRAATTKLLASRTTTTKTTKTSTVMDFSKLKACHDDPDMAWSLQSKYSKLTPADHTFVPWVLLDHHFIDVLDPAPNDGDFIQQVCRAYMSKGGSHPACASTSSSLRSLSNEVSN